MRLRSILDLKRCAVVLTVVGSCCLARPAEAAIGRLEVLAYGRWIQASGELTPSLARYPWGDETAQQPGQRLIERRILAARAMSIRSEAVERAWDRSDFEGTFQSLNTARALRELGDYPAALEWYRTARHNATVPAPGPDLDTEIFACAVLTGDSLSVIQELLNLVGLSDLDRRGPHLELAFRHYTGQRDTTNLDFLCSKVAGRLDETSPRVHFWYAYTQAAAGRNGEAQDALLALVRDGGSVRELEPWQAHWVARALPDLLYLNDRTQDAYRLYELLATTGSAPEGLWARYQLANRFLLSGEYDLAADIYRESCDVSEPAPWQQRACALVETAERLAVIRKEGVRHGTDGIHSR
jgi:hypothetical protein